MELKIRRAVKEDCPRLLELVHELATYEKAPHEVTVTLDHFTESGFGKNPVWWAFVAYTTDPSNGKEIISGFVLYYIRYSTWKGQRMYLEDILVTESARGKGIGKILLQALIDESEKNNLWTLQAGIFPENLASLAIHKDCGFRVVGLREKIGKMKNRWRDTLLLERRSNKIGTE